MNTRVFKLIALTLATALTSGCLASWKRVDPGATSLQGGAFAFEAPVGWTHRQLQLDHTLSKDGPTLQAIRTRTTAAGSELATERELDLSLSTAELADELIADFIATVSPAHVEVLANQPAELGGKPGFRLHLRWSSAQGVSLDHLVYAAVHEGALAQVRFQAPTIHYFERDLPTFEAFVDSVTLR